MLDGLISLGRGLVGLAAKRQDLPQQRVLQVLHLDRLVRLLAHLLEYHLPRGVALACDCSSGKSIGVSTCPFGESL